MVCAGDRQWQDAGFRHPRHRAAPEKRGEAEEDAGGSRDVTAREGRAWAHAEGVIVCASVAGRRLGDHAHPRAGPADQRGDAVLH